MKFLKSFDLDFMNLLNFDLETFIDSKQGFNFYLFSFDSM